MNFELTDDQRAIRSSAREFLADRCPPARVRELAEAGRYDDGLWDDIVALGWPALAVGEEHGGLGLELIDLAVLFEELGAALTPAPLLSSTAAALLVSGAGDAAQREAWLPGLAEGTVGGAAGLVRDGTAVVVDGEIAGLVVLVDDGRATLYEPGALDVEPLDAPDLTRRYARVRPRAGDAMPGDPRPALDRIAVALAAESVGLAAHVLDMTVAYARERRQYDRPIGSFQAVSHRCAQMYLETEGARSIAYYAAWAADHDPDASAAAAAGAKAYASDAAWRACAAAVQVHGGIGFTWEHDLHFFLKRARANAALFGSAREQRERMCELAGLPHQPEGTTS